MTITDLNSLSVQEFDKLITYYTVNFSPYQLAKLAILNRSIDETKELLRNLR